MIENVLDYEGLQHYDEKAKKYNDEKFSKKLDKTSVATSSTLGLVKSGTDITVDSSGNVSVNDDSHNHIISNVDGLQSALDAKVPTTRTINNKALSANITLSASDVGADASGSANTALSNAKAYTDTKINEIVGEGASETLDTIGEISKAIEEHQDITDALNAAIGNKVDKEDGKGLSTNDYTDEDKAKLDGIDKVANKYTHPTTSGNKHIPSGGSSGQILRWVADGTAVWGADNNTTYSAATQSAPGLMSAADKTKLNGVATGATKSPISNSSAITTSGKYALDAIENNASVEGTLAYQIAELSANLTHAMMPDYSQRTQVTFPYTATSDGWIQCFIRSTGSSGVVKIDGYIAHDIGQTITTVSYVETLGTIPIAKGQTATYEGSVTTAYFIPCIGM